MSRRSSRSRKDSFNAEESPRLTRSRSRKGDETSGDTHDQTQVDEELFDIMKNSAIYSSQLDSNQQRSHGAQPSYPNATSGSLMQSRHSQIQQQHQHQHQQSHLMQNIQMQQHQQQPLYQQQHYTTSSLGYSSIPNIHQDSQQLGGINSGPFGPVFDFDSTPGQQSSNQGYLMQGVNSNVPIRPSFTNTPFTAPTFTSQQPLDTRLPGQVMTRSQQQKQTQRIEQPDSDDVKPSLPPQRGGGPGSAGTYASRFQRIAGLPSDAPPLPGMEISMTNNSQPYSASGVDVSERDDQQATLGLGSRRQRPKGGHQANERPIEDSEDEGEDGEGSVGTDAQRRGRKAQLARDSRNRKKAYISGLEERCVSLAQRVRDLETLNQQLSDPYAAIDVQHRAVASKSAELRAEMNALVQLADKQNGVLTERDEAQLRSCVSNYVLCIRERQAAAAFLLDQLDNELMPSVPARFVLWAITQPDALSTGLWSEMLVKEVGFSQEQLMITQQFQEEMRMEKVELGSSLCSASRTKEMILSHFHRLNRLMESVQSVYTTVQLARFFLWIENNQWMLQAIPKTVAGSSVMNQQSSQSKQITATGAVGGTGQIMSTIPASSTIVNTQATAQMTSFSVPQTTGANSINATSPISISSKSSSLSSNNPAVITNVKHPQHSTVPNYCVAIDEGIVGTNLSLPVISGLSSIPVDFNPSLLPQVPGSLSLQSEMHSPLRGQVSLSTHSPIVTSAPNAVNGTMQDSFELPPMSMSGLGLNSLPLSSSLAPRMSHLSSQFSYGVSNLVDEVGLNYSTEK